MRQSSYETSRSLVGLLVFFWTGLAHLGVGAADTTDHPRLFFGPQDIPALRQRVQNEPYRTVFDDFRSFFEGRVDRPVGSDELDATMMRTQLGGLLYTITGDVQYAQRAKEAYLARIDSWSKGLPHYRTTYRQMHNLCIDYDLIDPSGVFTQQERDRIANVLAGAAARCMERGNSFNPYDYYLHDEMRVSNTNTDRLAAVGMFALTFPDHPDADAWLDHVVTEIRWQLDNAVLADGLFLEGTRYHGAVLRQIVPFAFALKRHQGIDLFAHPQMKQMFEVLIQLQTPPDSTVGHIRHGLFQ